MKTLLQVCMLISIVSIAVAKDISADKKLFLRNEISKLLTIEDQLLPPNAILKMGCSEKAVAKLSIHDVSTSTNNKSRNIKILLDMNLASKKVENIQVLNDYNKYGVCLNDEYFFGKENKEIGQCIQEKIESKAKNYINECNIKNNIIPAFFLDTAYTVTLNSAILRRAPSSSAILRMTSSEKYSHISNWFREKTKFMESRIQKRYGIYGNIVWKLVFDLHLYDIQNVATVFAKEAPCESDNMDKKISVISIHWLHPINTQKKKCFREIIEGHSNQYIENCLDITYRKSEYEHSVGHFNDPDNKERKQPKYIFDYDGRDISDYNGTEGTIIQLSL